MIILVGQYRSVEYRFCFVIVAHVRPTESLYLSVLYTTRISLTNERV